MLLWLGQEHPRLPVILSIPHSGEEVPEEAHWLRATPVEVLLTDVDRFVDQLYLPAASKLSVPALVTKVHRYAADLNRYPEDVDAGSVMGDSTPAGTHPKGFHWQVTTRGVPLMKAPIDLATHRTIVTKYHDAFHSEFALKLERIRSAFPGRRVFHFDCHSMPSEGTGAHVDQGQKRADVVISDYKGASASADFKDLTIQAFEDYGFQVSYNWPYLGGRITQRYGRPAQKHETIQIELNRALYMNESTREKLPAFNEVSDRLMRVMRGILRGLEEL